MTILRLALVAGLLATMVAPAWALEKFSLIHSSVSGSQAVLFVARDARIFDKHGLDVDIRFVAGGPTAIQALLAADVHAAVMGGPAALAAKLQGADTVIIAGLINTMDHVMIAQPQIKRPQDLKDKKIAVSRFGSSDDFAARFAVRKWGLAPGTNVTFLQIGEQGARLTALKAGRVDASLIQPPLTVVARKAGLTELAALADLEVDYIGTTVVATRGLIARREDLVRRFVRALVEGIHFYKTNKAAALASIGKFMKLEDPDALEETYKQYAGRLTPRAPYPTAKGVKTILDDLGATDPKAKGANPADFIESRFVRELEESGFIKALYGE
ncbi:MAG: hypothetical protein AUH81_12735 [Candidatus Rokubacteria bacterium 13_1_40CM_4_69_5]|nr:MAG: hypothetical protein AUH81_12735 [Candidatus Rokubacteria bacterium 13_1_40CM_4_69_5]OLE37891.1 MAG: hypothetical protein AUG00_06860 [Candidatus Rokubacteria bacterium 13_1_20CM_2_70_7]